MRYLLGPLLLAFIGTTCLIGCKKSHSGPQTKTVFIKTTWKYSNKKGPRDTVVVSRLKLNVAEAVTKMATEGYRIVGVFPITAGSWQWHTNTGKLPANNLSGRDKKESAWGTGWGLGFGMTAGVFVIGQR